MEAEQQSEEVQCWTAKRGAALVFSDGETTPAEAPRRRGTRVVEAKE